MKSDSNIPTYNAFVDQESLKKDICGMVNNETNEEDCVSEDF